MGYGGSIPGSLEFRRNPNSREVAGLLAFRKRQDPLALSNFPAADSAYFVRRVCGEISGFLVQVLNALLRMS